MSEPQSHKSTKNGVNTERGHTGTSHAKWEDKVQRRPTFIWCNMEACIQRFLPVFAVCKFHLESSSLMSCSLIFQGAFIIMQPLICLHMVPMLTYGKLICLSFKTTTLYRYGLTLRPISCNFKLPAQPQSCEYNIKPCWLVCGFRPMAHTGSCTSNLDLSLSEQRIDQQHVFISTIMLLWESNSITFSFNSRILNVVFVHSLGTTSCKADHYILKIHRETFKSRGKKMNLLIQNFVSNLQVMWCIIAT